MLTPAVKVQDAHALNSVVVRVPSFNARMLAAVAAARMLAAAESMIIY